MREMVLTVQVPPWGIDLWETICRLWKNRRTIAQGFCEMRNARGEAKRQGEVSNAQKKKEDAAGRVGRDEATTRVGV